ncbi:GNAT family N-acetyltransferase [Chryseobacterium sp. Chry.R1]|uniref:GNAT family N-acetyltransferase n=1 Tax=Chryseobacterium sp. Chry.R1 TaxID=3139392 RepID=UPI0031F85CE1
MEINIREAKEEELIIIQQMCSDTIYKICSVDYTYNQLEVWISNIEDTQRWIHALLGQYLIVAEFESKIIGFITLKNKFYIDYLYIHKNYQRRGIAKMLFKVIEKKAISEKQHELVSDVSITAKPFFENLGFKVLKKQKVKIKGVELINYRMIKDIF